MLIAFIHIKKELFPRCTPVGNSSLSIYRFSQAHWHCPAAVFQALAH